MLMRCLPASLSLSGRRLPPRCAPLRALPVHWARQKNCRTGVLVLVIFYFLCVLASCIALMEVNAVCSHIEGSLTLSIFICQPSKARAVYMHGVYHAWCKLRERGLGDDVCLSTCSATTTYAINGTIHQRATRSTQGLCQRPRQRPVYSSLRSLERERTLSAAPPLSRTCWTTPHAPHAHRPHPTP